MLHAFLLLASHVKSLNLLRHLFQGLVDYELAVRNVDVTFWAENALFIPDGLQARFAEVMAAR